MYIYEMMVVGKPVLETAFSFFLFHTWDFPSFFIVQQRTSFSFLTNMDWIVFLIGLLFHLTFAQDDLSNHGYEDKADTYFAYNIHTFDNCESATKCPMLRKIIRQEAIENLHVCNLNKTTKPPCPILEDNICICVKDKDCQEIYDILDREDYDMDEVLNVKNDFQKCGYESSIPRYCCPYPVKQCRTSMNSTHNPNMPCLFPYTYNGKKYNQCATLTKNSKVFKNICATKRKDGFEIGDFGFCSDECNVDGK